jgi:hypothetical protein
MYVYLRDRKCPTSSRLRNGIMRAVGRSIDIHIDILTYTHTRSQSLSVFQGARLRITISCRAATAT